MPLPPDLPLDILIRKLERVVPLSDEDRRAVQELPIIVRTLPANQDVTREADRPSQACLVLDGWLCGHKLIEGGRRQIISFHLAGDIPDLQTLRLGIADFSLTTLTAAKVVFIPHRSLEILTRGSAALAVALWHQTLVDAVVFREWMAGLGRRPAPERLAHLFCELYTKQRAIGLADEGGCPLPITQTDLADALGMTSVHVNRSLRELRGNGFLTLKNRRLDIRDWSGLASFADFDPTYLHLDTTEPD